MLQVTETIIVPSTPRAIDMKGGKLLLGLRNECIVEYAQPKQGNIPSFLMYSHSNGEVWGLDVADNKILTSADDHNIFTWDYKTRKMVKQTTLNEKGGKKIKYGASTLSTLPDNQCSRAVCLNKKNSHIAVALNNGDVQIRQSINAIDKIVKQMKVCDRWIECMSYSPDGKFLAVGTHVQLVHIFDVDAGYTQKGVIKGHSSYILALVGA